MNLKTSLQTFLILNAVIFIGLTLKAEITASGTSAPECIHFGTSAAEKFLARYPMRDVCVGDELNYLLAEDMDKNATDQHTLHPYEITLLENVHKDVYTAYVLEVFPERRKALVRFHGKKILIEDFALRAGDYFGDKSKDSRIGIEINGCDNDLRMCVGSTFRGQMYGGDWGYGDEKYDAIVKKLYTNGVAVIEATSSVRGTAAKDLYIVRTSDSEDGPAIELLRNPKGQGYVVNPSRAREKNCLSRIVFPIHKISLCQGDRITANDNRLFTILKAFEDGKLKVSDVDGNVIYVDSKFFNILN